MYGGRCICAAHTGLAAASPPHSHPRAHALPRDAGPWRQRDCGPERGLRLVGVLAAPTSPYELERGPEGVHFG